MVTIPPYHRSQHPVPPSDVAKFTFTGITLAGAGSRKSTLEGWRTSPTCIITNHISLADRMLEEPQYANVVRWGNGGKSFVVLEVRNKIS